MPFFNVHVSEMFYVITAISFLERTNIYYANFTISMIYQWIPAEI